MRYGAVHRAAAVAVTAATARWRKGGGAGRRGAA